MDLATIQPWALVVTVICLIALPSALVFRRNNAGAMIVAACCGLAALMVYLPQVHSVAFGPLKAEMQAKIDEASATISQLRSLASDLARVTVLGVIEQGGLGGPRYETLYAIRQNLERQLVALRTRSDDVEDILKPLNPRIAIAFEIAIEDAALNGRENTPVWKPLYECLSSNRQEPSVAKIQACLTNSSVSSPEVERTLQDFAEFQRTGHIGRLDGGRNH